MNGQIVCAVGKPKQGKTTFAKKFRTKKKSYAYIRLNTDFADDNTILFTNFLEFLDNVNDKTDVVCYIDEAFTCMPKRLHVTLHNPEHPHNKLADFLVNCRKMNRFVIIIFHSLKQIPDWLFDYIDYLVRFATNDKLQYQKVRFSSFPEILESLEKHPTPAKFKPDKIKLR